MELHKLTQPQLGIWETERFYQGTSIGNIGGTLLLKEELDFKLWEKAINNFIELNDACRIRIKIVSGEPFQYIADYNYIVLDYVDFTGKTKEDQDKWLSDKMRKPLDLIESNLCEFVMIKSYNGDQGYYVKMHHIVGDGWTISLLGTQTMKYYRWLTSKEDNSFQDMPSYITYAMKEQEYLTSPKYCKDKEYWLAKFSKRPQLAGIKLRENRAYHISADRKTFYLKGKEAEELRSFCRENALSPAIVFEVAVRIYFSRFTDVQDATIGFPVLNRSGKIEKETTGMFVSTVPVRFCIDDNDTYVNLCKKIASEHMDVFRHQKYPYNTLLSDIRKEHKLSQNLYEVTVSYQNAKICKSECNYEYSTKWYANGCLTEQLQLHIDDRDDEGTFVIHIDYLNEILSEEEICDFYKRIMIFTKQGIQNMKIMIRDMELVDEEERDHILYDFNDTAADYPRDKGIHQLFEEQVERTPNNIAVKYLDREITYSELNNESNKVAKILNEHGVTKKVIVGLLLDRSIEMVVSIIAVLKVGAIYLPIDPNLPKDRIEYILDDSQAKIIMKTDELGNIIVEKGTYDINKVTSHSNKLTPDDLAYIIYTSGTTGKPKGSLITHKNVIRLMHNSRMYFDFNENDIWTMFHSYNFDFSVWEMYGALLYGGKLIILSKQITKDPILLLNLLDKEKVTIFNQVPSSFYNLTIDMKKRLPNLRIRYLIFGGEALKPTVLQEWYLRYPNIKYINMYGITETTVHVTIKELRASDMETEDSNIGKPIPTTTVIVVDKYEKLVPIGYLGEMYVGGEGVGKGYLNRDDLTACKFVRNYYNNDIVYKSGDLAKWIKSGDLIYKGRKDHQVKIRGFRIELGEIESAVKSYGDISNALVVSREDKSNNKYLCLYYSTNDTISILELKKYLSNKLPSYMIPRYFVEIDTLPLTANGKIDKDALPNPMYERITTKKVVLPQSDKEMKIVSVIEKMLDISQVSVEDNFFDDLGIDSLSIIGLQSLLEKEGLYFQIRDIYQKPTIKDLCNEGLTNYEIEDMEYQKISKYFRNFHKTNPVKEILLTGATGFLGIHILSELLKNSCTRVICLVRKAERLNEVLRYYYNDNLELDKIKVLEGDIEQPRLGLTEKDYNDLLVTVDTVIHTAANVKHFGLWDKFYRTNTLGTENMIRFAEKADARLHYVSTLSVSGDGIGKQSIPITEFSEENLYIGQDYRSNVYIHTKYLAEKAVLNAIEKGLDACIYRVGNLTWREADGKHQINQHENGFLSRIRAIKKLKVITHEMGKMMVDVTPVDKCAEAIVQLALTSDSCMVFHLFNDNQVEQMKLLNMLGVFPDVVPLQDFLEKVSVNKADDNVNVLYLYLDELKNSNPSRKVSIRHDRTKEYFEELGLNWNSPDAKYMDLFGITE
ncbi:MAG: thioester reductase [Herbinix sp.]|nr:thioester reductase [Herbinix sp.]